MRAIPIANVYYLLSYAWRHVEEADLVDAGELEDLEHFHDLLGKVLALGTHRQVRRGLDRGYVETTADLRGVRGQILVSDYAKRAHVARGTVPCRFEELTHDVQHNRVLKSSLAALLRVPALSEEIRDQVRGAHGMLEGIEEERLDGSSFRRIQLDGNRRGYRFLLEMCRLLHECMGVDEATGFSEFHDFRDDYERMWQVFEDFLREFYRREQSDFTVDAHGRRIHWHRTTQLDESLHPLVPRMEADVILEGAERRIVIDTKYYRSALQESWSTSKVRSGHLYQLLAYLRNREETGPAGPHHEGLLLYPRVDRDLAADFELEGFRIRAATVDLTRSWREIHDGLLSLLAA